jgi:hypothetical protein
MSKSKTNGGPRKGSKLAKIATLLQRRKGCTRQEQCARRDGNRFPYSDLRSKLASEN